MSVKFTNCTKSVVFLANDTVMGYCVMRCVSQNPRTGRFLVSIQSSIDHSNKIATCRYYHDPLRKVDFIYSKTVIRLIFWGIKIISESKVLYTKAYVGKSNFS